MFWYKKAVSVKGYALAYTMLVGLIIIMLAGFCFSAEVKRRINIEKYTQNVQEALCTRETKEYLFSKMNDYIEKHAVSLDKQGVKNLFSSIVNGNKTGCDNCNIYYDKTKDEFIIKTVSSNGKNKNYVYDYEISDGKVKFIFIKIT